MKRQVSALLAVAALAVATVSPSFAATTTTATNTATSVCYHPATGIDTVWSLAVQELGIPDVGSSAKVITAEAERIEAVNKQIDWTARTSYPNGHWRVLIDKNDCLTGLNLQRLQPAQTGQSGTSTTASSTPAAFNANQSALSLLALLILAALAATLYTLISQRNEERRRREEAEQARAQEAAAAAQALAAETAAHEAAERELRRYRDPTTAGPAMVPGGVTQQTATDFFHQRAAAATNRPLSQLVIQDVTPVWLTAQNVPIAFGDGTTEEFHLRRVAGFRGRVRHPDGTVTVEYMLEGCGNDLRRGVQYHWGDDLVVEERHIDEPRTDAAPVPIRRGN